MTRAACLLLALAAPACARTPAYLVLATTTSVGHSGLLDALLPAWGQSHDVEIRPTLAGSGRALRMLSTGEADVVISHAPAAEEAMLAEHGSWRYTKIMFNEFVLAGPPHDPARLRAEPTLEEALRRLAASGAPFVSRGDGSGTHEREQALWALAGAAPRSDTLLTSGAGMAVTLRQASDRQAYTLTDRATFDRLRPRLDLSIVCEGDSRLLNTYAVIVDRGAPRREAAVRFADWLAAGDGRAVIERYRIEGSEVQPFQVWPDGAPRGVPAARPR